MLKKFFGVYLHKNYYLENQIIMKIRIIFLSLLLSFIGYSQNKESIAVIKPYSLEDEKRFDYIKEIFKNDEAKQKEMFNITRQKIKAGYIFISEKDYPIVKEEFQKFLVKKMEMNSNLDFRSDWQFVIVLEQFIKD